MAGTQLVVRRALLYGTLPFALESSYRSNPIRQFLARHRRCLIKAEVLKSIVSRMTWRTLWYPARNQKRGVASAVSCRPDQPV